MPEETGPLAAAPGDVLVSQVLQHLLVGMTKVFGPVQMSARLASLPHKSSEPTGLAAVMGYLNYIGSQILTTLRSAGQYAHNLHITGKQHSTS